MGMSASQARLLSITARMNDIEYKSQTISNTKLRLADEAEQVSREYTEALNKTKLVYHSYDEQGNQVKMSLNSTNLQNEILSGKFRLVTASGSEVSLYSSENKNGMKFSESQLYEMIESGEYMLQSMQTYTDADGVQQRGFRDTSVSGNTTLSIEADKTELAKAEAEYNSKTLKINNKEKLLDNDLKALDTEHNALKTEMDSIKSLIGNNVEKTFNLFS